ncbi:MAG: 4a-hydroxytetrahydrobiopterin dehydratase [Alphaproteobacteria bacterium]|jgi:4a-hydroxytetrahydrobiopterin dehydratase|nr:4a-hydroxytetrahydrobiopterin dehydratase [Henriciella sp.]MBO6696725.1 4a-hydroxytetrahydrobiopterin dehydratase [Henriciella sp.]MCH9752970.1 4a-hydroxytetrahydrobiopterin dehydratase [Alphaproteobacteria bacterium]
MMADRVGAATATKTLQGWTVKPGDRDAIEKTFKFADFKSAFAFMTASALKAEQMDHHPEWFNVYNRVEVTLTTHDANGVTALDVELAGYMDQLAAALA